MYDYICRRWWALMLRGIIAIILGVCAALWPGITMLTLVFLFGAFSIVDGIFSIALGVRGEADGTVWWTMVLLGVLAIAAGIIAFVWPAITIAVFLGIIAAYAIVRGVLEIIAAVRLRREIEGEWLLALSGVLSIVFGALVLLFPAAGIVTIAIMIGAFMFALGLVAVMLSLRLRRLCRAPGTISRTPSGAAAH